MNSRVNFISLSVVVGMETNYMLGHSSSAFMKQQNGSKTIIEGNRLHAEKKKQDYILCNAEGHNCY